MTQPTLFTPPPADGDLTERQRHALTIVRTTPGGLTADEVGAHLHSLKGRHPTHEVCRWCLDDGRSVLEALRKRGLVTRRRTGAWQALQEQAHDGHDPAGSGLPDGF